MSNIQVPTLSLEEQAKRQALIKKKQLFMYAILQANANGMNFCDGLTVDQFKVLLAEFANTLPGAMGISTVDYMVQNGGYKTLIFSHEFLKTFFGEENWWAHGCAMLKIEQPLLYLEPFLRPVTPKQEWK